MTCFLFLLFRFLCPRAGHFKCTVTNLLFEMEGEGEVLYRIDLWDTRQLDGLGQDLCTILSAVRVQSVIYTSHIVRYFLVKENKVELTVAHFNDDNVEIIKPLQVTSTHVIIHIRGLSLFGILRDVRDLLFKPYPISAQVLLFYKTMHSILYIHLLPGTVPVEEAYSLHCYTAVKGRLEFTHFVHYFNFITYIFSSENGVNISRKPVRCNVILYLPTPANSTEAASPRTDAEAAEFVDGHRETLIQRVSSVIEIADRLRSKKMVGKEMYNEIENAQTPQKQMRKLYDALDSGGTKVKAEFYKVLKEKLQSLVDELEAGTSRT
ncbi:hypothetical protein NFI96_021680 [Prochilodus magdalenae]|nr:hypothetical protein NFI96_021680 [Prochilodus magdalenae]